VARPPDWTSLLAIGDFSSGSATMSDALALERRAAELEAILESVPVGIYIGTPGGLTRTNVLGASMLGFNDASEALREIPWLSNQIRTRDADTDVRLAPEDEPFARALGGVVTVREVKYTNLTTGADVWVRCAAGPVRWGGSIVGAVAINTEITEPPRTPDTRHDGRLEDGAQAPGSHDLDDGPPPRVFRVSLEEVESLGVRVEVGARFETDLFDVHRATYEIVGAAGASLTLQRVGAMWRPAKKSR
jgi:hypothetical protein